jgi:hypothetical protein
MEIPKWDPRRCLSAAEASVVTYLAVLLAWFYFQNCRSLLGFFITSHLGVSCMCCIFLVSSIEMDGTGSDLMTGFLTLYE